MRISGMVPSMPQGVRHDSGRRVKTVPTLVATCGIMLTDRALDALCVALFDRAIDAFMFAREGQPHGAVGERAMHQLAAGKHIDLSRPEIFERADDEAHRLIAAIADQLGMEGACQTDEGSGRHAAWAAQAGSS